jgi:hypothetical protein
LHWQDLYGYDDGLNGLFRLCRVRTLDKLLLGLLERGEEENQEEEGLERTQ